MTDLNIPTAEAFNEHLCGVRISLRLAGIHIGECLAGRVLHDIATGNSFSGPGRLEAANHYWTVGQSC